MSKKLAHLQRIAANGIIAVIRSPSADEAFELVAAVKAGGIDIVEITMTVPGAVDVIAKLVAAHGPDEILIGAGTVLDSETARICLLAGAEFVVSPGIDRRTIQLCHRYRKIVIPGIATATELMQALETGVDVCKIFPATLFGPQTIAAFRGPFPQAQLMPTGGVNPDNVKAFIQAGCFAVGAGSELTAGAKSGDYARVTRTARLFVERIAEARAEMGAG